MKYIYILFSVGQNEYMLFMDSPPKANLTNKKINYNRLKYRLSKNVPVTIYL